MNTKSGNFIEEKLLFENGIVCEALPTKYAARFVFKSANALRIMKCRGVIQPIGRLGNEDYYAVRDLKNLLSKKRRPYD